MGVQLNIKDPETIKLARELADETGRSLTSVVKAALEAERRARDANQADMLAKVDAIVASVQEKLTPEMRKITSNEAMESLYDDGVPA